MPSSILFSTKSLTMAEIKGWMSLLFLLDNSKGEPIEKAVSGKRKLPKEKRDLLKSLEEERSAHNGSVFPLGNQTKRDL